MNDKGKKLHNKLIYISNNLLRIETSQILLKRKLQNTPDSIDKYFILKDYILTQKKFNDSVLEFGMAKFLLRYQPLKTTPHEKKRN